MKFLLRLLAMAFCLGQLDAGSLALDGTLSWNVTAPECAFRLEGTLTNVSTAETGTIKLVLWATRTTLPAGSQIVGEFWLGQLPPGYQFTDFTVKSPSSLPSLDGTYNFTIGVLEYTTAGWRNQLLIQKGSESIMEGQIAGQAKWRIPRTTVVPPPSKVRLRDTITLTVRATGLLNAFPSDWREKITLTVKTTTYMAISNRGRSASVGYTYAAGNSKLQGKSVKTGKLVLTDGTATKNPFKETVFLYFYSPTGGIYKSVTTGALWNGELDSSTAWGTFTLN